MKDARIIRIYENHPEVLVQLEEHERINFGKSGLNSWTLPFFIRYGKVFALYVGDRLVGLAELMKDWDEPKKAFIVGFSIREGFRKKGWGSFFLKEVLERVREDAEVVFLTVSPENRGAIELYEKAGFEEKGLLEDEYGKGKHRILMVKEMVQRC